MQLLIASYFQPVNPSLLAQLQQLQESKSLQLPQQELPTKLILLQQHHRFQFLITQAMPVPHLAQLHQLLILQPQAVVFQMAHLRQPTPSTLAKLPHLAEPVTLFVFHRHLAGRRLLKSWHSTSLSIRFHLRSFRLPALPDSRQVWP